MTTIRAQRFSDDVFAIAATLPGPDLHGPGDRVVRHAAPRRDGDLGRVPGAVPGA